jgi:5-keto-L-gluconate epimerase
MRISVTIIDEASMKAPIVFRGDYEESIKKAAEIGYSGIELHLGDPQTIDQENFMKLCKENNISVTSIGTGPGYGKRGLSLSSPDKEIRERATGCVKGHIDLASAFGSVVIVGLLKGLVSESRDLDSYLQDLESSLRICLDYAEEKNVTLVLEAINRYESDIFNTIAECVDFVKKFNTDHLKVHIDSYHMNIEETQIHQNIKEAGKYIGHVHVADSNRWHPGNAHFDFEKLIETLDEIDYQGALAVECLSFPNQQEAAEKSFSHLQEILSSASVGRK